MILGKKLKEVTVVPTVRDVPKAPILPKKPVKGRPTKKEPVKETEKA